MKKSKSNKSEDIFDNCKRVEFPMPRISSKIRDMLFINTLEKRLGRNLTKEEIEMEATDGKVLLFFPYEGYYETVSFLRLYFPEDVLSRPGM